jgi:hypothetical protein
MFRLTILVIAVIEVVISLVLVPWAISGVLVTALIGIPSTVLAYLCLKERENVKETKPLKKNNKSKNRVNTSQIFLRRRVVDEEQYFIYYV